MTRLIGFAFVVSFVVSGWLFTMGDVYRMIVKVERQLERQR